MMNDASIWERIARSLHFSIRSRIITALLLMGFLTSIIVGGLATRSFKASIEADISSHLQSAASLQKRQIETFLQHARELMNLTASDTQLRLTLKEHLASPAPDHVEKITGILLNSKRSVPDFEVLFVTDLQGNIVATTDPVELSRHETESMLAVDGTWAPPVLYSIKPGPGGIPIIHMHAPLVFEQETIAWLMANVSASELVRITGNYTGLGNSGETLLADRLPNGDARFLTPLRFDNDAALKRTVAAGRTDVPIIRTLAGEDGFHSDVVDYRGVPVFAVTTQIPDLGWGVLIKIDQEEAYRSYGAFRSVLLRSVAVVLVLATLAAFLLSRSISRPIETVTDMARRIRRGERSQRSYNEEVFRDRETRQLALAFDEMTQDLEQKVEERTRQLSIANERASLATRAAEIGIWEYSPQDRSIICDETMYALYGVSPEEFTCTYEAWESALHPDDRERVSQELQLAINGEKQFDTQFRILTPAGEARWIKAFATTRSAVDGTTVRMIGTNQDITARVESESALIRANARAEAATRAKSEFLANMSHEIRTPMNAITGYTYLLLQEQLTPTVRQQINKIEAAARSLLHVINDILDFSKIEAGKLSLEHTDFNLEEVLDNVINLGNAIARKKDIELRVDHDAVVPVHLVGDPMRLGQVLNNLVNNAVKFTERGSVSLYISRLAGAGNGVNLAFEVVDTGIGMDQDTLSHLFQPFKQADGSTTRKYGGTGLGLAISQQLVTLMGGSLSVESQPGKGSAFHIRLPFRESEKAIEYRAYDHYAFDIFKILIVEDDADALAITDKVVTGLGCRTLAVTSGEQAVDAVRRAAAEGEQFDFILMDWRLSGMDGIAAGEIIKKVVSPRRQPVILLETAFGRELLAEQIGRPEIDALLIKPVTASRLFDTLVQFVEPVTSSAKDEQPTATEKLLQGMRLLVVEDNLINQAVARSLLEMAGATVLLAGQGEEAIELLEQRFGEIDAVLMDVQMPVMDGLEATRRIRQRPQWRKLPIVAMTANATVQDRQNCIDAGMNDFLYKPLDPVHMASFLSQWNRNHPMEPSPVPDRDSRDTG